MAGLVLDPWQQFTLESALGERPDGKWASFEVGECVPRQNGKGGIIEARTLAGLYVLGERLIIHSAHEFSTALEAFHRVTALIEENEDMGARIKRVSRAHGEEGIELMSGQRVRFRTRTKGGGRGFSCDCLFLDEAMIIALAMHAALLPTLSARPNPQVWYFGSAVDQQIHEHGHVFAGVRRRGIAGSPRLAYLEWSAGDSLEQAPDLVDDRAAWAQSNPALGIRITEETIENERASMDARSFAVERLCIGDWPEPLDEQGDGIDAKAWAALSDPASSPGDPVVFAFDVRPDRSTSTIGVAAARPGGGWHVEIVERKAGTAWLPARLAELERAHDTAGVVYDEKSPAASLAQACEEAGVSSLVATDAREYTDACGQFVDAVNDATVRHLGTGELAQAVRGVRRRPLGDAWAWSRKSSAVDISPLVAVTLALWKAQQVADSVYESRELLIF